MQTIDRYVDRIAEIYRAEVHLPQIWPFVPGITEIVQSRPLRIHRYGRRIDVHVGMLQIVNREQSPTQMHQHLRHDLPAAFHRAVNHPMAHLSSDSQLVPDLRDSSHLPHPSTEKFSVSRYEMMAHTNGKRGYPLFLESLKTRSNPNFPRYSLTQAMVPIGTDLFSFGSRTNVLSRKLFGVTTEQIHSGHFYFTSSHLMSIDQLHQVLSNSGSKSESSVELRVIRFRKILIQQQSIICIGFYRTQVQTIYS